MPVLDGRRVVAVLFVSGLLGLGLVPGTASADGLGYPSTIGTDRDPDDLPEAPGPMSGTFVGLGTPTSMASALTGTTFLVSETGRAYRLPQTDDVVGYVPALSPDGSRVGYFPDRDGSAIRDLVSGETTTFARIRYGDLGREPYLFDGSRAWWSPDSTRLLIGTEPNVVLSLDGTVTEVGRPRGRRASPVGWIGDEVAWKRSNGTDPDRPDSVELVVAPVAGGPGRTIRLQDVDALSEVVGAGVAVSPDGSSLAVVTADGEQSGRFTLYSTADGTVTARSAVDHAVNPNCPLSWASGEPAVAGSIDLPLAGVGDNPGSIALLAMSGETLVRSRDKFAPCSVWAAEALSGPRDPAGVLASGGSSSTYVAVAVPVTVAVAATAGGWFLVRRRRRVLEPTS